MYASNLQLIKFCNQEQPTNLHSAAVLSLHGQLKYFLQSQQLQNPTEPATVKEKTFIHISLYCTVSESCMNQPKRT